MGKTAPRRSYGTGSLFVRADASGREAWYGQWRLKGRQVKRKLGPKRNAGSADGLTKAQAEKELRRLVDETVAAPTRERLTVADRRATLTAPRRHDLTPANAAAIASDAHRPQLLLPHLAAHLATPIDPQQHHSIAALLDRPRHLFQPVVPEPRLPLWILLLTPGSLFPNSSPVHLSTTSPQARRTPRPGTC